MSKNLSTTDNWVIHHLNDIISIDDLLLAGESKPCIIFPLIQVEKQFLKCYRSGMEVHVYFRSNLDFAMCTFVFNIREGYLRCSRFVNNSKLMIEKCDVDVKFLVWTLDVYDIKRSILTNIQLQEIDIDSDNAQECVDCAYYVGTTLMNNRTVMDITNTHISIEGSSFHRYLANIKPPNLSDQMKIINDYFKEILNIKCTKLGTKMLNQVK